MNENEDESDKTEKVVTPNLVKQRNLHCPPYQDYYLGLARLPARAEAYTLAGRPARVPETPKAIADARVSLLRLDQVSERAATTSAHSIAPTAKLS